MIERYFFFQPNQRWLWRDKSRLCWVLFCSIRVTEALEVIFFGKRAKHEVRRWRVVFSNHVFSQDDSCENIHFYFFITLKAYSLQDIENVTLAYFQLKLLRFKVVQWDTTGRDQLVSILTLVSATQYIDDCDITSALSSLHTLLIILVNLIVNSCFELKFKAVW